MPDPEKVEAAISALEAVAEDYNPEKDLKFRKYHEQVNSMVDEMKFMHRQQTGKMEERHETRHAKNLKERMGEGEKPKEPMMPPKAPPKGMVTGMMPKAGGNGKKSKISSYGEKLNKKKVGRT